MGRPGLTKHRKFIRLERLVGSHLVARGALETLWDSCYENGDEFLGESLDVEGLARWDGEDGKLTAALMASGFIEEVPDLPGSFQVHDLWHHAPDYVRKRRRREEDRRTKADPCSRMADDDGQCPDADRSQSADRRVSPDSQAEVVIPPSPSPSPSPSPETKEKSLPQNGPQQVVEIWNQATAGKLATARLTPKRAGVIQTRLREKGWLDDFKAACAYVTASTFHLGQNDRGWQATLDHVLQAGKATELAEKHTAPKPPTTGAQNGTRSPHHRAAVDAAYLEQLTERPTVAFESVADDPELLSMFQGGAQS